MRRILISFVVVLFVVASSTSSLVWAADQQFRAANNVEFSNSSAIKGGPAGSFVYYSQNDRRWANEFYDDNADKSGPRTTTIGAAGCGPTSIAMIVATLIDSSVTPIDTAHAGYDNGSLIPDEGTAHKQLLDGVSIKWPIKQTPLTGAPIQEVLAFVSSGRGYIYMGGVGAAPFTEGDGHIIVIREVDEAAQTVTVADSYRGEADVYPVSTIEAYRGTTFGIGLP